MASYNELNALIDAYINRNGVQAITGQILNGVLKAMVEQLGRGYTIMGAAIPTTDPGTPDGPECYFASETGTYTDFGGLQVVPGELALLCYTPSDGWSKATIYEGFREVGATIDGNVGTPSVGVSYADGVLSFDFHNMKGDPGQNGQDGQDGAAAGFGTIGADITGGVGTPAVSVESSGPATAKNLQFHFTNLKGETGVTSVVATVDNTTGTPACTVSLVGQQLTLAFTGLKGAQGDTGSSVDYPFTIVNNLTTDDATQALSAAQGVVLEGEITQLEAKVDNIDLDGTSTIDNEIVIQTDDGTQVLKVDKDGLEVTDIKAENIEAESINAEQIVGEDIQAESFSVPDSNGNNIFKVSESPNEDGTEEIVVETNGGSEIAKIDKDGVQSKKITTKKLECKDSSGVDIMTVEESQAIDDDEEISVTSLSGTILKIKKDGVRANHLFVLRNSKEREILAPPTGMKYAEIGDSITYLADNKYETSYDDSGTTLTGYKGWGYGRYLCKYLGIPYENHYPQGANGRGFSTYVKEWIVDGHWSFPDNINVWTIFLGTNDWGLARTPLGTKDDYIGDTWTTSNQTTYGAIRKIVDKIRSQNTNGDPPQIIFITPLQRGAFLYGATQEQAESVFVKSAITINADGEYEYTQNANGDTLKDVVDAILWVCQYESFKCVDWFNNSIFDKASLNMAQVFADAGWDSSHIFGTVEIEGMRDNLHPLPGGKIYKLMGARLANEIADRFQDAYFE